MSGRALRRLPVLALAHYIGIGTSSTSLPLSTPDSEQKTAKLNGSSGHVNGTRPKTLGADVGTWLDAMEKVVKEQSTEHVKLS